MSRWHVMIGIILLAVMVVCGVVLLPRELRAPTDHQQTAAPETPASLPTILTVDTPLPHSIVRSPLTISGKARGTWYFEASAPFFLLDASGAVIANGHITAEGDWMTTDFVPFTATLTFIVPTTSATGTLVLKNDNPSGDPTKDKRLEIPVRF